MAAVCVGNAATEKEAVGEESGNSKQYVPKNMLEE